MVIWKWTKEAIVKEASRFPNRGAFRLQAKQAYDAAIRQNILEEVCAHMRLPQHIYSDEELRESALRYSTIKEFLATEPKAFDRVMRRGKLAEYTKHMRRVVQPWTPDRIKEVALRCDSRREFSDLYSGAYQAARRLKIMDEVCGHMTTQRSAAYVYVYESYSVAYVGISSSPFKHRRDAHCERDDALGTLARTTAPRLLTKKKLPRSEAEALEREYIVQYAKTHTLLNIAHNPAAKAA